MYGGSLEITLPVPSIHTIPLTPTLEFTKYKITAGSSWFMRIYSEYKDILRDFKETSLSALIKSKNDN